MLALTVVGRNAPRWCLATLVLVLLLGGCAGDDEPVATTTTTTEPPPTTTTTEAPLEAGEVREVYVPAVGDCFDRRVLDPEEQSVRVVLLLDCELPHTFEVFATFDADAALIASRAPLPGATTTTVVDEPASPVGPDDDDIDGELDDVDAPSTGSEPIEEDDPLAGWPGEELLEREARLFCPAAFAEWVGLPYERSELEMNWLVPMEEAWNNGDRTIACTVHTADGERISGTLQGARR